MRNSTKMHSNLKHVDAETNNGPCFRKYSSLSDRIPARLVLYLLSWSGFLVSFMMRNDINFALVVMIKPHNITTNGTLSSDTSPIPTTAAPHATTTWLNELNDSLASTNVYSYESNATVPSLIDNITTVLPLEELTRVVINDGDTQFDWSPQVQSIILGSFYWWYVISQVVGGIATQVFGTKKVFGWSQFATAACSLGIPYAASFHYGALIVLRSIQGFASGLTWPAMYAIVGFWIPPAERSRFMSSFQGFSIGIGLLYPLCGFLIAHWGWRIVFYTTGTIGMVWCVIWYFLAFNTPAEHPRISTSELQYIELNVSQEIKDGKGMKVPWKSIFQSLPAWSIGVTTFGRIWVHYTFIMSGPVYMKHMLGFDIQTNGLLSGLPFLLSYLSSVVFCYIADVMVTRNIMSLTNVRKLFTAMSQNLPGIFVLIAGYYGYNLAVVLTLWYLAVPLITASYAGAMANIVDIAPNLAGPVLAFAQTIHMTASFLSPLVTGFIVNDPTSQTEWLTTFWIAFIISNVTYIVFQIYGTAKIQPWNYPSRRLPEENRMLRDNSNVNNED